MTPKAVSKLVPGRYSESVVTETAATLRAQLGVNPTFGLLFASIDYMENISDVLEIVRLHGHVPLLAGCSTQGPVGTGEEHEGKSGFSLILFSLPGCRVHPFQFTQELIEASDGMNRYWQDKTGLTPEEVKAWLVFADPFTTQIDLWLRQWNKAYPDVPCIGGLAAGPTNAPESWLFLNDRTVENGLALGITGPVRIETIVSQGCKPIGEPLTVTHAQQNVLLTIGSKPAFEVLNDVYQSLPDKERQNARGHLFAGLAMNEYVEDFKRGDFLIRNIVAADPSSGGVAINALPRVGQTMQYHLRDAAAATDDLMHRLAETQKEIQPFAGFACLCNGRGRELFTVPNHDTQLIDRFFPDLPLAGFFGNGEIGPVGDQNFIHGYTAAIALFAKE